MVDYFFYSFVLKAFELYDVVCVSKFPTALVAVVIFHVIYILCRRELLKYHAWQLIFFHCCEVVRHVNGRSFFSPEQRVAKGWGATRRFAV